jgi:phosphotransferase system enzyme I (PtsI)
MAERRLAGRVASAGFAAGPLARLAPQAGAARRAGAPSEEAAALRGAIAAALEQLRRLGAQADADGADILDFQIAMLEDEALTAPVLAAIEAGDPADKAWGDALAREIAAYEAAEDEAFRARASDFVDIRDGVLAALNGVAGRDVAAPGAILIGEDLTPSRFLAIDWSRGGGIALTRGSASGHVATLARARGVPMLVGVALDLAGAAEATEALIDGESATLTLEPESATRERFDARAQAASRAQSAAQAFRPRPACSADGAAISVCVNVSDPAELDTLDVAYCDGIGLVRTEFLFERHDGPPDEETQYRIYRRLAEWAAGKPVTIRTLDAGADKPIAGLTLENETNPFLGLRGIRLSLARPETFRTQLKALCRASAHGAVEIMLPMVAVPRELEAARAHLDAVCAELARQGVAHRRPALGIMVEVPAAALAPDDFDAAFFSIGSNDLTQYVMAAARDMDALAELNDSGHPAVLRLIREVAACGARRGCKVSLCGDAAADVRLTEALLGAGLRSLSVPPSALGPVKQAIARVNLGAAG